MQGFGLQNLKFLNKGFVKRADQGIENIIGYWLKNNKTTKCPEDF